MNRDSGKLRVIQYNVGRSYDVTAQLLRHLEVGTFDVIALQEPWINPRTKTTHNAVKGLFHTVLPTTDKKPRVCLYIHREIDPQKLKVHAYDSGDILSVTIDAQIPIAIHNIYNPRGDKHTRNAEYGGIPSKSVIPIIDQAPSKPQTSTNRL